MIRKLNIWLNLKLIRALQVWQVRLLKSRVFLKKEQVQNLQPQQEKQVNPPARKIPDSTELNNQLELSLEQKVGSPNLSVLVPREIPVYKYTHPYGAITVYVPSGDALSAERVYLMLEQAKHDMFHHLKPNAG